MSAGPIDASGDLLDGTHVDGVVQLRQALLKRPEVFVGTMTEKLLTYALKRGVEAPDMPTVRAIVRDVSQQDYRFSSLVLGIVKSPAFQMRSKARASAPAVAARCTRRCWSGRTTFSHRGRIGSRRTQTPCMFAR